MDEKKKGDKGRRQREFSNDKERKQREFIKKKKNRN